MFVLKATKKFHFLKVFYSVYRVQRYVIVTAFIFCFAGHRWRLAPGFSLLSGCCRARGAKKFRKLGDVGGKEANESSNKEQKTKSEALQHFIIILSAVLLQCGWVQCMNMPELASQLFPSKSYKNNKGETV
jgi:hypothetical protein